jgi:hypothetical protein
VEFGIRHYAGTVLYKVKLFYVHMIKTIPVTNMTRANNWDYHYFTIDVFLHITTEAEVFGFVQDFYA